MQATKNLSFSMEEESGLKSQFSCVLMSRGFRRTLGEIKKEEEKDGGRIKKMERLGKKLQTPKVFFRSLSGLQKSKDLDSDEHLDYTAPFTHPETNTPINNTNQRNKRMYRSGSKSLNVPKRHPLANQSSILRTSTNPKQKLEKKVSFKGTKTVYRFNPQKRITNLLK